MPAYKDNHTGKWFCKFYYKDWQGNRKQKKKSGFELKRDALEYEKMFLEKYANNSTILFSTLKDLYFEDITNRLKPNTVRNRKSAVRKNVAPYFDNVPVNEITPLHIRKWHSELLQKGLQPTTLKNINSQLASILNFGVKYYGLTESPMRKAGSIGKQKSNRKMEFYTLDEFKKFISYATDPMDHIIFTLLYYGGFRIGELLALTLDDIDFNNKTISVKRNYTRIDRQDILDTPKTDNSIRDILMPDQVMDELLQYTNSVYGLDTDDRIFPHTNMYVRQHMERMLRNTNFKKIRIHDFRHSHVSLCIELGFSPYLIAERIGDTVEMVLNVYGHLYPSQHDDLVERLNETFDEF